MQEKLLYPFTTLTVEKLIETGKKIKYYSIDDKIKFYINNKEVQDEETIFIATLAYIKLLTNLVSKKKKNQNEYMNKYIDIIKKRFIDSMTDLRVVNIDTLIKELKIKDNEDNKMLLALVIKGYEKENDIEVSKTNPLLYNVISIREIDTINMEKEKVLSLVSEKKK